MENDRQIRYVGTSMNPWLLQNDILEWVPVSERLPIRGDVIIFRDPAGSGHLIIHRIIQTHSEGFYVTRGDNSLHNDQLPIHRSVIQGIVTGGIRGERPFRISSGYPGLVCHLFAQQRQKALPFLQQIFFRPYHYLCRHGIFHRLIQLQFRQRLVVVKTRDGYELQVYLGGHLVGWKGVQDRGWTILPPYRLFLNNEALPDSVTNLLGES